jgi:hypothetical protein
LSLGLLGWRARSPSLSRDFNCVWLAFLIIFEPD